MHFFISATTLKQQAKLVVKNWPFSPIKNSKAREILCQLYGYKSNHHYLIETQKNPLRSLPITSKVVIYQYPLWVKALADLGSMNQIQAKGLLHQLWPAYLSDQRPLSKKLYQSHFYFHGECNDFLNDEIKSRWIEFKFDDRPSVKDSIESMGIPHTEIGAISVSNKDDTNHGKNKWVDFSYLLFDGDNIEVYSNPHSTSLLPFKPIGQLTFLLDVHLGSLARYLRMAGFDCLHEQMDYGDKILAELSSANDYILLTRDVGLLKRANVRFGRWIRSTETIEQFKEVIVHYQLYLEIKPFKRCVKCNGNIKSLPKHKAKGVVPDGIFTSHNSFRKCERCEKIYWKGSHFEKVTEILNALSLDQSHVYSKELYK